ncbi:hypothetical protein MMC30_006461 [Trapelia coarctata]|nr:hypothetical protein [Trapelia coarctata]
MPAPSLYHLARKACIKNIRSITDVGDVPYDLLRPILLKIENPEQLVLLPSPLCNMLQLTYAPQRELEEASPQLCGADAELWREFIKRDIPNWEKKPHEPTNPKNWSKVYRKLRQANQKEVEEDEQILKAALDGIKIERAKHTSKVVDPKLVRLPKLPRMGGMRVEGGRTKATSSPGGNPSLLTFASGSKTKMLTGKGVLDKARREARELSLFSARKSILATPTHKLNTKATQIRSAPQGLVEEHRRPPAPRDSSPKKTTVIAPRRRNAAEQSSSSPSTGMTFEERERRLKALTNPSSVERSLPVETSEAQDSSAASPPSRTPRSLHPPSAYVLPKSRTHTPEPKGCRPAAKAKAPVDPFMPAKRRKVA